MSEKHQVKVAQTSPDPAGITLTITFAQRYTIVFKFSRRIQKPRLENNL